MIWLNVLLTQLRKKSTTDLHRLVVQKGRVASAMRPFSLVPPRYGGDMKRFSIGAAALFLTACGPADNEPGPGGVTVGEARALDEAAEMIEAKRLPPEVAAQEGADAAEAEPTTEQQ